MEEFEIGKTIRELRIEHHYSQATLGELLNITDSAISKWESGDSCPAIDQINSIAKLFGLTVDEIIHYQEKKNAEQIRLKAEEAARQEEKNRSIKNKLKENIFCKVWDRQQGYCNEARITVNYDGTTLTLHQKEDPNIVLYDGIVGFNLRITGKCFIFRKGKWESCPAFENTTDRWQILFDFDNPIERIRFSFDEDGIDDYEFLVNYRYADKEAYNKKIEEKKMEEQAKIVDIRVFKSSFTIDAPGNYGTAHNSIFTGIVNVVFNAISDAFSYAVIELFLYNQKTGTSNLLKSYRLKQGEKIWMEDKIAGSYHFILSQYDKEDNLIFKSKLISIM